MCRAPLSGSFFSLQYTDDILYNTDTVKVQPILYNNLYLVQITVFYRLSLVARMFDGNLGVFTVSFLVLYTPVASILYILFPPVISISYLFSLPSGMGSA